jgi:hypothetical protein
LSIENGGIASSEVVVVVSYSGAVGVLGCATYAERGGEIREPEPVVEEELEVVTPATGMIG